MPSHIDLDQLSPTQQAALQQYTSVTDQDVAASISILEKAQWNVQVMSHDVWSVGGIGTKLFRLPLPGSLMARLNKRKHCQPPHHPRVPVYLVWLELQVYLLMSLAYLSLDHHRPVQTMRLESCLNRMIRLCADHLSS